MSFECQIPEHEKLKDVQPLSQSIGAFLEWCAEEGIWLCSHTDGNDWEYVPISESVEKTLARYFGIDLVALENEKRALLEEHRALAAKRDI